MDEETEEKLLAQNLLSVARSCDVVAVRNLLKKASANVQDAGSGITPLHAAALGEERGNADTGSMKEARDAEGKALDVVQLLLENGAIWNDLDRNGETPACIAWRRGKMKVYQAIVDAGVRAELLLSKLKELDSDSEGTPVLTEEIEVSDSVKASSGDSAAKAQTAEGEPNGESATEPPEDYIDHWDSNADFLRSSLRYTDTQLLDSSSNAVMMDWETEIMKRHAELLLPKSGLRAMNIGHGMGIVDTAIQSHNPAEHHIVEAHPAVLQQMRNNGWYDKPGVTVHEGRWQEALPKLIEKGVELDAIYYDTFAESYSDLKELFTEHVIGLLEHSGRFGFYNGLGADRRVSYDVYTNVRLRHQFPIIQY